MPQLNEIVRSVIRQPKEVFVESMKKYISSRADTLINEKYEVFGNSFFIDQQENIVEETEVQPKQNVISEDVSSLIKVLKESHFDQKTILHKFRDGNTIAITPEDSNCLIQMHDSLNIINQEKMRNLMLESFAEYNKILKFSKKHRKD